MNEQGPDRQAYNDERRNRGDWLLPSLNEIFGKHNNTHTGKVIEQVLSASTPEHAEFMVERYDKRARIASLFAIVLGTLIFLLVVFGYDELPYFNETIPETPVARTLFAGLLGLLVAVVIDRVAIYHQGEAATWRGRALNNTVDRRLKAAFNTELLGDEAQAINHLAGKIARARNVKNTFVNLGGAPSSSTEIEIRARQIYESFFEASSENRWKDIVSVNELYGFRHLKIAPKRARRGQHIVGVLEHNMPLTNFTIVEYGHPDLPKELYFGWLYDEGPKTRNIFRSADPRLVEVFDQYFEILTRKLQDQITVDYSQPPKHKYAHQLVDKAGCWLTISTVDGSLRDIGLIEIKFEGNEPKVRGGIVYSEDNKPRIIHHHKVVCSGNKIYFEYKHSSSGTEVGGFCVYEFERNDDRDNVTGYYQDTGGKPRCQIFGTKLEAEGREWDYRSTSDIRRALLENEDVIRDLSPGGLREVDFRRVLPEESSRPRSKGATDDQ